MVLYNGNLYGSYADLPNYEELSNKLNPWDTKDTQLFIAANAPELFMPFPSVNEQHTISRPIRFIHSLHRPQVHSQAMESDATSSNERQVNQLNYNSFICIMAQMVQKYAPQILDTLDTKED